MLRLAKNGQNKIYKLVIQSDLPQEKENEVGENFTDGAAMVHYWLMHSYTKHMLLDSYKLREISAYTCGWKKYLNHLYKNYRLTTWWIWGWQETY